MGGIVDSLFGGSKQSSNSTQQSTSSSQSSSDSGNHAYDFLKNSLSGNVGIGNNAMGSMAALLGQGGDAGAAQGAFNNYLGSTGYNFMLDQGSKAITGNKAASGMLKSGSTLKALTGYGQNLGSQYFNNYLTQLQGLVGNGLSSANTISGAGNYSNSQSTSTSQSTGTSSSKGHSSNGIIPGLFG